MTVKSCKEQTFFPQLSVNRNASLPVLEKLTKQKQFTGTVHVRGFYLGTQKLIFSSFLRQEEINTVPCIKAIVSSIWAIAVW